MEPSFLVPALLLTPTPTGDIRIILILDFVAALLLRLGLLDQRSLLPRVPAPGRPRPSGPHILLRLQTRGIGRILLLRGSDFLGFFLGRRVV